MAGGFPVGYQFMPFAGSSPSSGHGVSVTPSATANTLGSWTELISSTPYSSSWAMISIIDPGTATALNTVSVNIGIGASGSETVLIANLIAQRDSFSSVPGQAYEYLIPMQIPGGTRLAANCQSSGASSAALYVSLSPFNGAFGCISGGGAIDTYGFSSSATKGVLIDPGGTALTKGAYSEVATSTTYDLAGFVLAFDSSTASGSGFAGWTIDVGIGASGSEVVILPDLQVYGRGSGTTYKALYPGLTPFIPIQIPAGSRIAVRAQCTTNSSVARTFGVTLYGVRL